jgi:hypothetical protein
MIVAPAMLSGPYTIVILSTHWLFPAKHGTVTHERRFLSVQSSSGQCASDRFPPFLSKHLNFLAIHNSPDHDTFYNDCFPLLECSLV